MHTVAITGLIGYATSILQTFTDAGYECELIEKGNFIVVYNTTSATVRLFLADKGYGGGVVTEID